MGNKIYEKEDCAVFRDRLFDRIFEKKITEKQFCEEVGISKSALADYKNCRCMPNAFALKEMCIVLNCSADYLLDLTDKVELDELDKKPMHDESRVNAAMEIGFLTRTNNPYME